MKKKNIKSANCRVAAVSDFKLQYPTMVLEFNDIKL